MLKKPQILVIDSDENILLAFKNFLLKNKIIMVGTTAIDEAIEILVEKDIDLIITDIRSDIKPGINFIEKARRIKRGIPIITLTSYPDIINANALKPYGIKYLFIKPLDLAKLQSAILRSLKDNLPKQSVNKLTKIKKQE